MSYRVALYYDADASWPDFMLGSKPGVDDSVQVVGTIRELVNISAWHCPLKIWFRNHITLYRYLKLLWEDKCQSVRDISCIRFIPGGGVDIYGGADRSNCVDVTQLVERACKRWER